MMGSSNGHVYPCVFIDVNTQRDFCRTDGAHPVANAEALRIVLRRMFAWALRNGVPLVSSIDSHRGHEAGMSGRDVYCVDGTDGQRKVDFTLVPSRTTIEVDNTLNLPLDLFSHCQQVVFRQRGGDLFGNPKAERFLTQLPAREFLLFGNSLEGAVKSLALGLATREKRVSVVANACGYWNHVAADLACRQLAAKGVNILTMEELVARKISPRKRYPRAVAQCTSVRRNGSSKPRSNGRSNGHVSAPSRNGKQLPTVRPVGSIGGSDKD